jgi:RNA polymerase sigma factor for flagellar operon FliA
MTQRSASASSATAKERRFTVAELWERYRRDGSLALRHRLIVPYAPLATFVAGRVAATSPASVDGGDLVGHAMLGLIDAVERYDPGRGVGFQPYALRRIRGAILDGMRSSDWAPRSVRRKARAIETATAELGQDLGRVPTPTEVADRAAMSMRDYHAARRDLAAVVSGGLHELPSGDDPGMMALPLVSTDPAVTVEEKLLRQRMVEQLRQADRRDRTVLTLYYFEGLTLAEIGQVLGVGESRVSQLHASALARLRAALQVRVGAKAALVG